MPPVEENRFSNQGSVHLDAIRGIAALVVVLGHTRSLFFTSLADSSAPHSEVAAKNATGTPQSTGITIGNEAVMVFFVLSGFLVGGSAVRQFRQRRWSWKSYLTKRLTRLWVVLLPALFVGLILDRAGLNLFAHAQSIYAAPIQQGLVSSDMALRLGWRVLLGNALFTQDILVPVLGTNDSLWSLTNEFWYYILFPLLLSVVFSARTLVARLSATAGAIAVSLFVGSQILILFPVWVMGAIVANLPLTLGKRTAASLAVATSAGLLAAMFLMRRFELNIYAAQYVIALLSSCLLYLVMHSTAPASTGWYGSGARFLSHISYTLYLVHLPIAVFLCACIDRPWHLWTKSIGHLSAWVGLNAAVVFLAYLVYLLFEARTDSIRHWLTKRMQTT